MGGSVSLFIILVKGADATHSSSRIIFSPSTQKKAKCDPPSGFTDIYWCTHKAKPRPVDTQHEPHPKAQITQRGNPSQVNAGVTGRSGGLDNEQEKKWQAARAQYCGIHSVPTICTDANIFPRVLLLS